MGSQSAVMMKMAGEQWQYGKRRISAMSNEEFNKLTPIKLYEIETSELRAMIPLMQESMRDMNKLTPIIVTEMVQMFKDFAYGLVNALQSETDSFLHPMFNFLLQTMGLDTKILPGTQKPGFGTPPITETGPTFPTRPTPQPPTQEEKRERNIKTLDQAVVYSADKSIVGSGLNRTQLLSAVKKYENLIRAQSKRIQNTKSLMRNSTNRQTRATLQAQEKLLTIWQNVHKNYKLALSWVLANNKNTP